MLNEERLRARVMDFLFEQSLGLGGSNQTQLTMTLESKVLIEMAFRAGYEAGLADAQAAGLPDWLQQLREKIGSEEPGGVERIHNELDRDPRTGQNYVAATKILWRQRQR